jgi:hypothetical protein
MMCLKKVNPPAFDLLNPVIKDRLSQSVGKELVERSADIVSILSSPFCLNERSHRERWNLKKAYHE